MAVGPGDVIAQANRCPQDPLGQKEEEMISYPLGRASPIAAVGLLLAGCGGSSQSQATIPLASSSVRQTGQHDKSWMLPEAKSKDLLYVARNSPGEISVYTYPKGKPVGAITGISGGQSGICSDIMGNSS